MSVDAADLPELLVLLSAERLGNLSQLTGSDGAAIDLHQETLCLGTSLLQIIATVEISLRNAVCENLTSFFGLLDWLSRPPVQFRWRREELSKLRAAESSARRARYAKLAQTEKAALDTLAFPQGVPPNTSHLRRVIERRKHLTITEGKIVAELTFYFWKRLFGPEYEHSLWKPTLKRTFPNKKITRAAVSAHLEAIYQARNRLAHHEPVLHRRFDDTFAAVEFVAQNLGVQQPSPTTPLAKLIAGDLAEVRAKADQLHAKLDAYRI